MKAILKSSAALLSLFAALHSPYIFADDDGPEYEYEDPEYEIGELGDDDDYVSPIPEADTYAMMLAGLGLVGFMVYRRRTL